MTPHSGQRGHARARTDAKFGQPSYFGWVLRKDPETESFAKAINDAMLKMTDDGRIKAIQEKWMGSYTELPREVPVN